MKRQSFVLTLLGAVFCLLLSTGGAAAAKPAVKGKSCAACHASFADVLPQGHAAAKGTGIGACLGCHKPDIARKEGVNVFSARLHRAHAGEEAATDCATCHTFTPGKRFGLIGQKSSLGAPTKADLVEMQKALASWKASGYTDSLHAKANIVCGACHGKDLPKEGAEVENKQCLACHGPADRLAAASAPKDFPDRNPHKSHLGEINCTVCHKGHVKSETYCLNCHKAFKVNPIPGGEKK
jgi:hypothetical protein